MYVASHIPTCLLDDNGDLNFNFHIQTKVHTSLTTDQNQTFNFYPEFLTKIMKGDYKNRAQYFDENNFQKNSAPLTL